MQITYEGWHLFEYKDSFRLRLQQGFLKQQLKKNGLVESLEHMEEFNI